jgi:hypothetical protein
MSDLAGIPKVAVKDEEEGKILHDMQVELKPAGAIEAIILERIVAAVITLRRLDRVGGRVAFTEAYRDAEDSLHRSLRQLRLLRQSSLGRQSAAGHRKPQAHREASNQPSARSAG